MKKYMKRVIYLFTYIFICLCFSACGAVSEAPDVKESETNLSEGDDVKPESGGEENSDSNEEGNNSASPVEPGVPNVYHVLDEETVESDISKYGEMKSIYEEYQDADGSDVYYYDMECFYFDDSYPAVLNETLQAYYDSVEEGYIQDSQVYTEPFEGNVNTPYNSLIFQYFTYVGEDYVSLVYNSVCYMGGAHPYSALDGITIDCRTGEMVSLQQFLDDSEEEIGRQLQAVLGMDAVYMEEWDYYLSETRVVFFYYDPRHWEPVATRRVR